MPIVTGPSFAIQRNHLWFPELSFGRLGPSDWEQSETFGRLFVVLGDSGSLWFLLWSQSHLVRVHLQFVSFRCHRLLDFWLCWMKILWMIWIVFSLACSLFSLLVLDSAIHSHMCVQSSFFSSRCSGLSHLSGVRSSLKRALGDWPSNYETQ